MEEKNREILKQALADLPQHQPDADLWNKIEASLDFEYRLQRAIPEMQLHEPDAAFWDKIEKQLEPAKEAKHFRLNQYYQYFAAAAASVVVLITSIYFLKNQAQEKVKIAYSEEVISEEQVFTKESQSEDNTPGIRFIQEHCSIQPEICANPEVKELKSQLEQLEEENKKIKHQIEIFGADPMLIRNQIKIENLKAECTKELIQIIIS